MQGFIAYERGDEVLADALQQALNSAGAPEIQFWRDRQIRGGAEWDREIKEQIRRSSVMLFLLTGRACMSRYIWSVEFREAYRRWEKNRHCTVIIPLTADAVLPLLRKRKIDRFQAIPIPESALINYATRTAWIDVVVTQVMAAVERLHGELNG